MLRRQFSLTKSSKDNVRDEIPSPHFYPRIHVSIVHVCITEYASLNNSIRRYEQLERTDRSAMTGIVGKIAMCNTYCGAMKPPKNQRMLNQVHLFGATNYPGCTNPGPDGT